MSKNLFLLDKMETVQKDSTELKDSIAHNESIAENFLKLIGDEKLEQTVQKELPTYDESIDILSRAFANKAEDLQEDVQATTVQNNFQFQQQLQNMVVERAEELVEQDVQVENFIAAQNEEVEALFATNDDELQQVESAVENNADLMPTETTTQYANTLYEEEIQESVENKVTVQRSKKVTVLVAVCIAIMAIILALICINVGVINNLQSNLDDTNYKYNTVQAELKAKQEELINQLNPSTIIENAMKPVDQGGLGMIKP